jgi:twitching motility protein PilT
MQLSVTLQGVISQTLLPKLGGGRTCAQEIMIGTDAVRSLIREGKTTQLFNVLQTGSQFGMQTLESHLARLVQIGHITPDEACSKANNPQSVLTMLGSKAASAAPAAHAPDGRAPTAPAPAGNGTAAKSRSLSQDDFEKFRQTRKV